MSRDEKRNRAKRTNERASPNVTEMLMELADIHMRLLSCFMQNDTIKQWSSELDDVMERIYQEVKEPD